MATIRSRQGPQGRKVWHVQIRKKGRPTKTRTFDLKADAEEWARGIERAMDRGHAILTTEEERITLAQALERYIREVSARKRGAAQEIPRARRLASSSLGPLFLSVLGGRELSQYRDKLLDEGKAAATIRLDLALISHLFTIARKEWGMASLRNPAELVRKPKPAAGRDRRLLVGEEERLIAAAGCYREFPELIRFALATAMRRSEILGMLRKDLHFDARLVHVPETKDAREVRGRDVPLSSAALQILRALPPRLDGHVWSLTPGFATTGFARIVKKARRVYLGECAARGEKPEPDYLCNLRFHDLRHEATSRMFERGLNPMEVASVTGHKTLQMLKRYTHLRAEDLAKKLG